MIRRFLITLALLLACSAAEGQIIGSGVIGGGVGGGGSAGVRDVTAIKSGTYLYVRTHWSATLDLVQKVDMWETPTAFNNSPVKFVSVGTIPIATADADVPTTSYTTAYAASIDDDIAPIFINGTYIGANHGAAVAIAATMNNHGKTVEDVGSEWTDGDGDKFYIMRIVSANQIWVLSENKSATSVWSFLTAITGNALTHSSGATHTDGMTFSVVAAASQMPAIKNDVRSILANGVSPITADGVTKCRWLEVRHNYTISDVPSMLSYVISQVGSSTQPSFTDASIDDCASLTHTYRYSGNGACTVEQTVTMLQDAKLTYMGGVQNIALPVGGAVKGYTYIPGLSAITVGANTYDFSAIAETTTIAATTTLPKANWLSATVPPDRYVSYTGTAANTPGPFGWCIGIHTQSGAGVPATRANATTIGGFLATTRKVYPYVVEGGSTAYPGAANTIPSGTVVPIIAYRCPINYGKNAFTNVAWYRYGGVIYLVIDVHATVTDQAVALERELAGRTITVIDSHQLTIAETVVGATGITIDTTDGYGWVLARLN